jgi:phenylacetate-coenzyme A ligase PaaK-like adenylate-forming protein
MISLPSRINRLGLLLKHPHPTREKIADFQSRQLSKLLRHACRHVPYYRDLFSSKGFNPDDISSIEDLSAIPLTSKDDLRNRPLEDILSNRSSLARMIKRKTSGSSGKPFTIYRTSLEDHLLNLFRIQVRREYGWRISDRTVIISETPLVKDNRRFLSFLKKAINLYRSSYIDCYQTDTEIIKELEDIRPDLIIGYPTTLARLASRLLEEGGMEIRPRFITTGGGVMSASIRRLIEEGFSAPVFDIYGAHEFNILAWECPNHNGYHVCENNIILEILTKGKAALPGETGEVVVTGLHSFAMPFIRYRTGDIATMGDEGCSCGSPFSTIEQIQGRIIEYFHLPGGRVIHPYEITGSLVEKEFSWISQHQLIQENVGLVVMRIKPFRPPGREKLDRLQRLGQEKIGEDTRFKVELVKKFTHKPEEKFHSYVCNVKAGFKKTSPEGQKQ